MRALKLLCLLTLTLSLPNCASVQKPLAVALSPASDPAARKAEIRRQLAAMCPTSMTAAELNATADYVAAHHDAAALVGRLLSFDKQTSVCRTGKAS